MSDTTLTAHSEYLPLHSVFLRPVRNAFVDSSRVKTQWQALNFLSEPDFDRAVEEYHAFETSIRAAATEILLFPQGKSLTLDAVYCRDASVATDFGMILCNMGKVGRLAEPASHRAVYEAMGIPILGAIESPGTLEGGDLAWLDRNILVVGHSYRTNRHGINQLKALLEPRGITVITAELPHFRGPSDVFHLMSILSPVDKDLAVVHAPLMPISLMNVLTERGFSLVEVPEAEFDSLGCNVLAVAPRSCIMAQGNPMTEKALRDAGCRVTTYAGTEISLKGGGGPTCLTRPYMRMATAKD